MPTRIPSPSCCQDSQEVLEGGSSLPTTVGQNPSKGFGPHPEPEPVCHGVHDDALDPHVVVIHDLKKETDLSVNEALPAGESLIHAPDGLVGSGLHHALAQDFLSGLANLDLVPFLGWGWRVDREGKVCRCQDDRDDCGSEERALEDRAKASLLHVCGCRWLSACSEGCCVVSRGALGLWY